MADNLDEEMEEVQSSSETCETYSMLINKWYWHYLETVVTKWI